jgi:hypothetical protein
VNTWFVDEREKEYDAGQGLAHHAAHAVTERFLWVHHTARVWDPKTEFNA